MRRYFELGALIAALLTFAYLAIAFFTGVSIDISTIGLSILGGIFTGAVLAVLLYFFSPGEAILEGEEDNYIKK